MGPLPAGNGVMIRTDFAGYVCARVGPAIPASSTRASARTTFIDILQGVRAATPSRLHAAKAALYPAKLVSDSGAPGERGEWRIAWHDSAQRPCHIVAAAQPACAARPRSISQACQRIPARIRAASAASTPGCTRAACGRRRRRRQGRRVSAQPSADVKFASLPPPVIGASSSVNRLPPQCFSPARATRRRRRSSPSADG